MHTVCQTKTSEKFEVLELSGNLFDSTDSIAHSISAFFKLAAGFAKQVSKDFPTGYPEFVSKASKGKVYPQQISPNRFLCDLIVESRFCSQPTYFSLRVALEAILQSVQKHKNKKISIPQLSTGLDKLDWLKVKKTTTDVFHNSSLKVTVYRRPQQQNFSHSGTRKE